VRNQVLLSIFLFPPNLCCAASGDGKVLGVLGFGLLEHERLKTIGELSFASAASVAAIGYRDCRRAAEFRRLACSTSAVSTLARARR
jgi:hypothetical protein